MRYRLFFTLLGLSSLAALPHSAVAQTTQQAKVVQVHTLTEQETLPHEHCQPLPQGQERCRISQRTVERVRAYQVTYEYQGQLYSGELPYHPGEWVSISLPEPGQRSYGSQRQANAPLQPGRKSYGSAPSTGASTSAIEYHSPQPDIPILVDLRGPLPATGRPRSRPGP